MQTENVLTLEKIKSPAIARAENRPSLFQTLFFKALSPMKLGWLRVDLPDGSAKFFGEGGAGLSASLKIRRPEFFKKCILYGDIGFGESYVEGDWDSDNVAKLIEWFLLNVENAPAISGSKRSQIAYNLLGLVNKLLHWRRMNTHIGSVKNIREHYDLSNDFFRTFLDPSMTYSCAYYKYKEQSLEDAQSEKYDRLCRKLRLKPGEHVLEIGCGWGGFALHAAKNYGVRVTGITISREQFDYATARVSAAGLSDRIQIVFSDYRDMKGIYDKIVSIEMLEAVGHKYFESYFEKCGQLLAKNGLLGIQVITCPDSRYDSLRKNVDWIQKHFFPGSLLPSLSRLNRAIEKTGDLFLHDLEDMGHFYGNTLAEWQARFRANLSQVKSLGFDEYFLRKWDYYLSYCMAAFQMRNISVVQAVYTRPNNASLRSLG